MTVIYLREKLINHLEFLGSNMGDNHRWTYDGWSKNGSHSYEWMVKTKKIIVHALSLSTTMSVRCPCNKC
jgi:hypothetical protein